MDWSMFGAQVLGAMARGTPAGPAISSSDPVSNSMFDASGWAVNFAGVQTATSSPSPSQTGAPGGDSLGASAGIGISNDMLIIGAVMLLAWVALS